MAETITGERIALITDSCTNVPEDFLAKHHIYVAPMTVIYSDGTLYDGIDVFASDIYERFEKGEVPTTSTPTPADVTAVVEQAIADGYDKLLAVTIASGLSSTHNLFESVLISHPEVESACIDTRNIGIGSGVSVMHAAQLIEQGKSFAEIVAETKKVVNHTKIFFVVDTLEYLYKGGRINKAVYSLGTMLNLRPIITCRKKGAYEVCGKARGRNQSLAKAVKLVQGCVKDAKRFCLAVADGGAEKEARAFTERLHAKFPSAEQITYTGQISPVLAVHTGPGLIGVVVQVLD